MDGAVGRMRLSGGVYGDLENVLGRLRWNVGRCGVECGDCGPRLGLKTFVGGCTWRG